MVFAKPYLSIWHEAFPKKVLYDTWQSILTLFLPKYGMDDFT